MEDIIEINEKNYEAEVLGASKPVLLDFYAPWCVHCTALSPTIGEIGKIFSGRAVTGIVNTDEEKALADAFGIFSVPTLVVISGGEIKSRHVGGATADEISAMLEREL